jgi:hypothetical protein
MFEHLDEVPVRHHRFIISLFEHRLLFLESLPLIEGIIELTISIPDLRSTEDYLESLDRTRIFRTSLRERGDECRMIHEKCGSRDLLACIFPEGIGESFTIGSIVFHTELC